MTDAKAEMQYILLIRLLDQAADAGLFTTEELQAAKRLVFQKCCPKTVWEYC